MENGPPNAPRKSNRMFFIAGVLALLVVGATLGVLLWQKNTHLVTERQVRKQAAEEGPLVRVVAATRAPEVKRVEFIGEARPYTTTTLYAKVSGYLREINVDKGDAVKEGEIVAVIESPEIDRQYEAAVADAKNRRSQAKRAWKLLPQSGTSQESAEAREAEAEMAEANASAMATMREYKILRAPFGGVVTARFVDPGALIQNAANAQTTTQPVVTLSETDRLRVFVYLDQKNAALVKVGDHAEVNDVARPEVQLKARVSRTSMELDAKTRTLLTEVDVDNRKGKVIPGSFVRVVLHLKMPPAVQVPCEALSMQKNQYCVGILNEDRRVSYREVGVVGSDGKMLAISSGLQEGEKVVLNPGMSIPEGTRVQAFDMEEKK
jgi:membrane fusion protein, multidrug efflux system